MKTFISWSGDRSKYVAETLSNWLEQVLQSLEPWISTDIDKGKRWSDEIASKLKESKVAIICLTKDNLDSKWIHFEAGAIAKNSDAYVCTFLFDITAANVQQPLSQFQNTRFEKGDILKLLKTINGIVKKTGGKGMKDANLISVFEIFWEQLETKLANVPESSMEESDVRNDRELLEESLQLLRGMKNSFSSNLLTKKSENEIIDFWLDKYAEVDGVHASEMELNGKEYEISKYMAIYPDIRMLLGTGEILRDKVKGRIAELPPF
ncbi:toll/interleukin-1 receptor domain-containing protein [Ancylomarina sp. YFZ004]